MLRSVDGGAGKSPDPEDAEAGYEAQWLDGLLRLAENDTSAMDYEGLKSRAAHLSMQTMVYARTAKDPAALANVTDAIADRRLMLLFLEAVGALMIA